MKITAIIRRDIKTNTRSGIKVLALIVAVLLPLAYGFLYLWAFWNPYENMKDVPVAVVNEDAGAFYEEEWQHYGKKITDELGRNDVLDWKFTDRKDAEDGLDRQEYYAVVIIPESFSSDLASAESDEPEQAVIFWETRDSTSFLFTTYFRNVIAVLGKEINKDIIPGFSEAAKVKLKEADGKLAEASEGAAALSDGLDALHNGSAALENNLREAEGGSRQLAGGLGALDRGSEGLNGALSELTEGASTLSSGIRSASSGAGALDGGIARLGEGAETLKDGSGKMLSGAAELASGANKLDARLDSVDESMSPFYPIFGRLSGIIVKINEKAPRSIPDYAAEAKERKDALLAGTGQLADGSSAIADKMADLDEGVGTLKDGIDTAADGAAALSEGLAALDEGSGALDEGLARTADGARRYAKGVDSAYQGSQTLANGLSQLARGSGELTGGIASARQGAELLSAGLEEGRQEIGSSLPDSKIETLISIINEPVTFDDISKDANDTYGAGFVPYFVPLSLWMGALILTLIIPVRDPKLSISGVSKIEATVGKFFLLALIGIAQAVLLSVSIICGLGLNAKYPVLFVLFCILISLTSIAIMQLLSFLFDKAGELIGIILLMVQLTSASGTFPIESAPRFFQMANPLVPMTYAIRGLRLLVLGGNMDIAARQAGILAAFLLAALALKALATKKTVKAADIYPLIEL